MTCAEVTEMLAVYALGALDPEEATDIESHLAGCRLHEELAELTEGAAVLAFSVEEREPPPGLRSRILAAVAEGGPAVAAPVAPALIRPARWHRFAPYAAAAVFAVVALGLLVWNVALLAADDTAEGAVVVHAVSGEHGSGHLVHIEREGLTYLTLELVPLESSETYQVWVLHEGVPTPAGLLPGSTTGPITIEVGAPVVPDDVVAVTIEPQGGSAQPTTDPILSTEV